VPAASVHGRDGLGDIPNNAFNVEPSEPCNESAVRRYMVLSESRDYFVLVCTGPLTNLASALNLMSMQRQREFWQRCKFCVVMGGAFEAHGNITAAAEFNTHFDPVAVHLVLESWRIADTATAKDDARLDPIYFVPLDTTEMVGVPLHKASEKVGGDITSPATPFLRAALRKYGAFHSRNCARPVGSEGNTAFEIAGLNEKAYLEERVIGESGLTHLGAFCYLHDPLAMWMALHREDPEFGKWWSVAYVDIDLTHGRGRGQMIQHDFKKVTATPSRSGPLGTKVLWLDPKEFGDAERQSFVSCIKKLLNIDLGSPSSTPTP
jgi:inosine-uridine nucleoside N-ribohydrolase